MKRGRIPCGVYLIFLELRLAEHIRSTGREWRLPPGVYAYAGSARTALFPRILRHLKFVKKIHWHLDLLTTRPTVGVPLVLCTSRPELTECRLIRLVREHCPAAVPVAGFGNSDCPTGCPGHLLRLGSELPATLPERLLAVL